MAVTFDEARQAVLDDWPDYDVADYGFEDDDHWFLILLPERAGGRIPAVAKATGEITWINENADIYTQEHPVGSRAPTRSADHDSLRLRGILTDEDFERAAGKDITPGNDELHHYWTRGKGLARWKTWTELVAHLSKHVPLEKAKTFAAAWFHERYGFWPGDDKNRVMHGKPPRGEKIGPG